MSDLSPAEAAAIVAADPDVAHAATVMAAEALAYCAQPGVFGRFRRSCLEAWPQDQAWLTAMEPGVLATFAEVLAPTGGSS